MGEQRTLTLAPERGGLNNQRLALLGLVDAARTEGALVELPEVLTDFLPDAGGAQARIPLASVFDESALTAFLETAHLLSREPATEALPYQPTFERGAAYIRRLGREFDPRTELGARFFRACRIAPDLRRVAARAVAHLGGDSLPALQLRIENDWRLYLARRFEDRSVTGEDLTTDPEAILAKVVSTEAFANVGRILACCDEGDLPVAPEALAEMARRSFGVELVFKHEWESAVGLPRGRFVRSAVDFQLCLLLRRYIGLSRSTFSNMLCFAKTCEAGDAAVEHYIYNVSSPDRVERRLDRGTAVLPTEVTAAEPPRTGCARVTGKELPSQQFPDAAQGSHRLEESLAECRRELARSQRRFAEQAAELERVSRRLEQSEHRLERALGSRSMRIGHAVLQPARMIRDVLRSRRRSWL